MARQLNLLSGQVIATPLHTEMQQSYLEYAMSVIVGRALPDVRDGLKPVHRRILYAMHELGLTPDRPYRKCARVVGDVLGKYHPHGDQSVYDALVRLVQEFSSRYPLLAGHGNFGSVDNDPPAAMRYTETRLASIGNEGLLTQVGEATVDFISNFDNSQQEPTVLPAQLPFLLLNGSSGIAVGMATNVPPHNLGEVVDGLIALIDNSDLSDERLRSIIPAPDFPTGGEIVSTDGIAEAYTQGRGSIVMRGVAKIEQVPTAQRRRTKTAIVVTELPFQVNKASWIEKTASLVNAGRLEGISDIRDESDRDGIRVVIELKREASPQVVLHHLYQQTDLMSKFGAIFLALVDSQPRQLTLKQILQEFLNFREQTLIRQYTHELEAALRRGHIVEGLLNALANLDAVIEILRNAPDGGTAKISLESDLQMSEAQADAILAMPMRRLTGLERQKLQEEFEELSEQIRQLRRLIDDRSELMKSLKKELRSLKRQYGDPRRTRIIVQDPKAQPEQSSSRIRSGKPKSKGSQTTAILQPVAPAEEETFLEFTHRGYVRRLSAKTGDSKSRSKADKSEIIVEYSDDFNVGSYLTNTGQNLAILTRTGKAYPLNVGDIPTTSSRSRGTPLITLLPSSVTKDPPMSLQELILAHFIVAQHSDKTDLILVTQQGKIKRLSLTELMDLTNRGITIIKLKDQDELGYASLTRPGEQMILATSGGRVLRLPVNDEQLPPMGRTAQGSQVTRLRKQERLVSCLTVPPKASLLLVSELGFAKRISLDRVRSTTRGAIGTQLFQFKGQKDALAGMVSVNSHQEAYLITSESRIVRFAVDEVKLQNEEATGNRLFKLNTGETIIGVRDPLLLHHP
ncbi:MAG: DNA topoisomerase (ATP-hydrolyzing) [Limnoraphis sp.]